MFLTEEVSLALMRLGQSDDQSAGRLCSEIIFLCRAVEEQVVRSRVPDGAGNLQRSCLEDLQKFWETVLSPPPADSKETKAHSADAEYALVRLCSWKISGLGRSISYPDEGRTLPLLPTVPSG